MTPLISNPSLTTTGRAMVFSSAYKYFGLLYQWGRKEPFTGQGPSSTVNIATSIYDANGNLIRGAADTDTPAANRLGGFIFNNGAADRTTTLIRNPRTHYYNSTDYGLITGNPNTWTVPPTLKSIYDPCPYGYRVSPSSSFSAFTPESSSWSDVTGGWLWSCVWPAGGRRAYGDGSLGQVGAYVWMWNALAGAGSNAGIVYGGDNGQINSSAIYRTAGNGIRCIPE